MKYKILALLLCIGLGIRVDAAEPMPLFDAHLHYNWEPTPRVTTGEALRLFEAAGVRGILANSRPNAGTHALYAARSDKLQVVPFLRPYRVRADVQTWFNDPQTMALIEEEYQRHGYFAGIGEFHLHGEEARSPVVAQMVRFARERKLMLHAHSDVAALEILFSLYPEARIIWAHTGFSTPAEKVAAYLERYPAVWCELSYRYGIADAGKLTPEWKRLFERYPDRFLLGSDTWISQRWDSYGSIMAEYRAWLAQLPPGVAEKIAFRNAEKLFKR